MSSNFKTQQEARRFAARAFRAEHFKGATFTKAPTFQTTPASDRKVIEKMDKALEDAKKDG